MVLRHGQVIAEGWWTPYKRDHVHLLYSLSKSFTSTAVGFAISFVAGYLIQRAYALPFEYSWAWGLTAALIGLLGGALGALYPAVRAANLDAVSALAYE